MILRGLLCVAVLFSGLSSFGQNMSRQNRSIFPEFGNYEANGWLFAGGFTFMQPWPYNQREMLQQTPEVASEMTYTARGRMGVNAEIGRFNQISTSGLIKYLDYSLGFKYLRGVEKFQARTVAENGSARAAQGKGVFNQGYLSLNVNFNNYVQFGDFWFLRNTLGFNGDYRILSSYAYETKGLPINTVLPVDMQVQLHYKIGVGYKISKNMILIPSLETPILTLFEFEDFKSDYTAFSSEYRPLIIRLELLLLDHKSGRKCPTGPKKSQKSVLFGKPGKR